MITNDKSGYIWRCFLLLGTALKEAKDEKIENEPVRDDKQEVEDAASEVDEDDQAEEEEPREDEDEDVKESDVGDAVEQGKWPFSEVNSKTSLMFRW